MKITKQNCWVIVPAYHEQKRIGDVVKKILATGFSNVIVVDDGSHDDTGSIAHAAGAVVLTHILNLGKGAAMKTGADCAVQQGAKAIVFVDGDGQHNPEELGLFLEQLNLGKEIVFGARRQGVMPLERRVGRWLIRAAIKLVYRFELHDPLGGYRAVTAAAYKKIRWTSRGYGVESEMIARAGKEVLEYAEVPVQTIYHDRHKGMTVVDGIKVMVGLIWWRITH